jgi:hypothetical protein
MEFLLIGDPFIPTFGNILDKKAPSSAIFELIAAANILIITVLILTYIKPKYETKKR